MIGIYKIINIINNKIYIGSSKNITKRWNQHIYDLNKNIHSCSKLQDDWNLYGKDNFKFDILEEVSPNNNLLLFEQEWINKTKSNIFGYNSNNNFQILHIRLNQNSTSDLIRIENNWFKLINKNNLIKQIGVNEFFLLVNLLKLRTINNKVTFNRQLISSFFGGARTEYFKIAIKTLDNLKNHNFLYFDIDINNIKSEDFIIADINFLYEPNDIFELSVNHLEIINNCEVKINKPKLLALYCSIKYLIDNSFYMSLDKIMDIVNISDFTIIKYLEILNTLELIKFKGGDTNSNP